MQNDSQKTTESKTESQQVVINSIACSEFVCSACRGDFVGDPYNINGAKLCSGCKNAPLFTLEEIAAYLSGWASGPFDKARKIGEVTLHNARLQLRDTQDGINTSRRRGFWSPKATITNRHGKA